MERKVLYTEDFKYFSQTFEVDDEYAYLVFRYDKNYMDTIMQVNRVYSKNDGYIEITDEEQKEVVVNIAKNYPNFISIEKSPLIFGDVYHKVEELKDNGILDNNHTIEICDAFLFPAMMSDDKIIAFRWDICDSDWYIKNIQAYVADEYKADFVRMLSFYKLLCPCLTTKECLSALYDILISLKKEKQKQTYIFKDTTGYYMIGHTKNVPQRYGNVRVGNTTLKMVCHLNGNYASQIHKTFAHKKVEGIWFELTQDDLDKIKNFQNK